MEYRNLGRTGIRVSPLCLGCMMFGAPGKTSAQDSYDIIDHAIESGINFLDTANVYTLGQSEIITGQALKRNGHRDHIVLATKCHGKMFKPGAGDPPTSELHAKLNPNQWGNSRRQIIQQCDASLKRLQTDYIDLYQIHRPHPDCAIDETLRALDDLVTSGKVRYIGCSTFAAWQIVEAHWTAEKLALNRFVTEQPPYHPLDRRIERELVPMAQTFGMALIPWSPLAGGFLSGKYKRNDPGPEGSRFGEGSTHFRRTMLDNDRAFDILETLEAIAEAHSRPVSQVALSWCMHQPGITSPIIGPRTLDQLSDNLAALDLQLTEDDRSKIDEAAPPGSSVQPFYEGRFGPHPHRV
ncbi:MAG: aldo/keto reductase [Planctomycetota bacterium]